MKNSPTKEKRENPVKIVRWEDKTLQAFTGPLHEVIKQAEQDERTIRGLSYKIV